MATIHPIGMPENKSERDTIAYFSENLPDDYIVFHNLELSNRYGLPYEYDIIVLGEYAVYTVEVKGYQGVIKGNAYEWELESGAIHKSPIPLSNKKAKIVGGQLTRYSGLLNNVWVQPIIVLSDDNVRIQLNDEQSNSVLHLQEAVAYMMDPRQLPVRNPYITSQLKKLTRDAIATQFRPLHRQNEIGDYTILETIDKNNLYTTLLAQHKLIGTQDRFILKVYSFNIYANDEARRKQKEWILRDANALHKLGNHPNIVRAHIPFPWQDNQIVLPLDWIDGYSLRGLLDNDVNLDFSQKIETIIEVGNALQYSHSRGVIHRDVRPENIVITHEGPVKLINFDCSRVEGRNMQTIATRVGRQLDERYVAPEVWQNPNQASYASDLYSLGIVAFELVTGRTPYEKILAVFNAKGLPELASKVNPVLPPEIDSILEKICAFNPVERYSEWKEALEDLTVIGIL